jgi:uncharacterized protein
MLDAVAVILMSKYPEPGRVKTRLQPDLSPQQCSDLHRILLLHTLRRLSSLRPGFLYVAFDPPQAEGDFRRLLDETSSTHATPPSLIEQGPGDLGQRIARIHAALAAAHPRQLFLGVDSPDLPADHLLHAARLTYQAQVTLGPTADGGYWCLGLSREVDVLSLLTGIDWSSGHEAEQTIDRAAALGYSLAMADGWDDVDRIDDLRRLIQRLAESSVPENQELHAALSDILKQRTGTA